MSKSLFDVIPKMKTANEIVKSLKKQGIHAELCKKAACIQ